MRFGCCYVNRQTDYRISVDNLFDHRVTQSVGVNLQLVAMNQIQHRQSGAGVVGGCQCN